MRNEILENQEFSILSRSIDNAEKCTVVELCDDCFKVKLKHNRTYEIEESVELFAMTKKGQLYFETIIKDIQDDIISVWYPISLKYLQRREYSRIQVEKDIILSNNEKNIPAKIIDISAGGLKTISDEQLQLLNEYVISVNIDNKEFKIIFEPIRIEIENGKFITSGRFKNITSYDRIALVQYCFRKQIENSNK